MKGNSTIDNAASKVRLDKWLWAARFFKTRSLGADEAGRGRVQVNGQAAKASREVRIGDRIEFRQGQTTRTVIVRSVDDHRGSAAIAGERYAETPESIEQRTRHAMEKRANVEPSMTLEQGRPTKRDRRQLAHWNRWSASVDRE